jgi:rSAM/selenodomain-associated transferase 1
VRAVERALIVLARAPVPGKVKTRLTEHLGPEQTARLYACFVRDTLAKLTALPQTSVRVYHTPGPPEEVRALESILPPGVPLRSQGGRTFGDRLFNALHDCAQYPRTVLVGTDSPTLPTELVVQAFDALRDHEVVLGPATDGGYYLLGVREAAPRLFQDISWSTSVVFAQTVERCRELGLRQALLPPWYDVDEPDDLNFLRGHVLALEAAGGECPCPYTCALLAELFAPVATRFPLSGLSGR